MPPFPRQAPNNATNAESLPPAASTLPRKSFSSESQAGLLHPQSGGGEMRKQSITSNSSASGATSFSASGAGPAPLMYSSSSVKFQSLNRDQATNHANRHPSLYSNPEYIGQGVAPAVPMIPQQYNTAYNPYVYAYNANNGYSGYYGGYQQQ